MDKVEKYNNLVKKWNKKYGGICQGMPVKREGFDDSIKDRFSKRVLSEQFTERQKVKHTVTIIGDFAHLPDEYRDPDEDYTRGELAHLIVNSGKDLLDEKGRL